MGKLYLIPNFISENDPNCSFPANNLRIVCSLKNFIIENSKPANLLLKKSGVKTPFQGIIFYRIDDFKTTQDKYELLLKLSQEGDFGLISDAGMPSVADPGEEFVYLAHELGIAVSSLVGPSSVFLALASSGLDGEKFTFHGYLPIQKDQRKLRLKELEGVVTKTGYTQIFIETPYRNQAIFDDILKTLQSSTILCIAVDLSGKEEFILTKTIESWRKKQIKIPEKPTVFLIGKL